MLLARLNNARTSGEPTEQPRPKVKRDEGSTSSVKAQPSGCPSDSKVAKPIVVPKITEVLATEKNPPSDKTDSSNNSVCLNSEQSHQSQGVSAEAKGDAIHSVKLHEKLADKITMEAESLDYSVTKETSIPQHGRIDLVLTRGKKSIACEISDTTQPGEEADHIRLRLKAGFPHVAVISCNRRKLELIRQAYLKLCGDQEPSKVGFYVPEEFYAQLFKWATDDPEGGEIERGKPRRRPNIYGGPQMTPEERAEQHKKMLEELVKRMKRK